MSFKLKGYKFSEHDCHKQLAAWLEIVMGQTKAISYHSSPNGFLRKNQITNAKKAGMRSGWPDVQIHFEDGRTIFFELKLSYNKKLSDHQERIHAELKALGYDVHVIRFDTPNECVNLVRDILNQKYGMNITC